MILLLRGTLNLLKNSGCQSEEIPAVSPEQCSKIFEANYNDSGVMLANMAGVIHLQGQ